jgi:hypothetical protein
MATGNSINANSTGLVKYDGAGTFTGVTVTQYSPIVGAASNGLTSLGPLTDGQLVIGSTGASPVAAAITAGTGISVTNGAGSISIATTLSVLTWSVITADQNITVGNGYICNKSGLLTLTLPASPTAGQTFAVTGMNTAAGWKIAQNANQQIFIGTSSTTIGTGGSLASINIRDSVELVCVVGGSSANWNVINSMGNITVV